MWKDQRMLWIEKSDHILPPKLQFTKQWICEIRQNYRNRLTTKPTKWHVHPAKTLISQGIRQVWSESLPSAWRKLWSLATDWAHDDDSDQTGRMPRLTWVFAWHTCHFVDFVMRRLIVALLSLRKKNRCVYCNMSGKIWVGRLGFFFFSLLTQTAEMHIIIGCHYASPA